MVPHAKAITFNYFAQRNLFMANFTLFSFSLVATIFSFNLPSI
ncbi:hypothetical protein PROVRETT_05644 [Providencia rettgeri DSM 1131]|nr:hypothetical protein PROVRETT_05644 [Providencia rettgeri DSM 1131]